MQEEKRCAEHDNPGMTIDFDELMDRVCHDNELLSELIELFAEDAPNLVAALKKAVAEGDANQVKTIAHAIKGAVGNFSAYKAYRAAFKLEKMGTDWDQAEALQACEELECELEEVLGELQRIGEQGKQP